MARLLDRLDAPFARLTPRTAPLAAVGLVCAYAFALAVLKWFPRYDCALVAVVLAAFRALSLATPRDRARAVFATSLVLLVAFLVHLWTLGYEGRNAVFGGILPWSDSHDFYDDALRLAHGDRFTEVSSKRPLYSAAFAGLVRVAGGGLRLPLFACALAAAGAMTAAALAVWRTHGWKSAAIVYLLLLFFERRWTGFVQTEHLGMPLGAVGFALAWRAAEVKPVDVARARRLLLFALFALTLGLVARAGAFFVLPALAIWGARSLAPDRASAWRYLAATVGVGVAAFAVHVVVLKVVGSGVTFSDYPGILYGLEHGEDYTFLARVHPELDTMPIAQRVGAAWSIVLGDIAAHPGALLLGLLKSGAELFVSPDGMFSYVWTNPDDHVLENAALVRQVGPVTLWVRTLGLYSFVNAIVMGALAAAFVVSVIASLVRIVRAKERSVHVSMLGAVAIGVITSAPFTPPWITSGMQVQTVTLAFVAALPAVLLLGGAPDAEADTPSDALAWVAPAFAVAVLLVVLWLRTSPAPLPTASCGSDTDVAPYLIVDAEEVEAREDRSLSFRDKAMADLETSMQFLGKHNPELTTSFAPYLRPGTVFATGYDACKRNVAILVDDGGKLGDRDGWCMLETTTLGHASLVHVDRALCPPP